VHEFFNVKNEYGCAADTYVSVYGSNRACRAHLHGGGGNAFYTFFAVRLDDFQGTVDSVVVNADKERGVAVQKETAGGRNLSNLEALGCQTGVDKVSVIVVHNCDNQFHKNFPCPCVCKGYLSFDICIGLNAAWVQASIIIYYYNKKPMLCQRKPQ